MHYLQGSSRNQTTLFPTTLDEYITEDNAVRFIDAFVNSLDLKSLGFQRVEFDVGHGRTEALYLWHSQPCSFQSSS